MSSLTEREQNGWIPASVGCHWTRGEYHISTVSQGDRHGYTLTRNREELASFVSFAKAEQLANRRRR